MTARAACQAAPAARAAGGRTVTAPRSAVDAVTAPAASGGRCGSWSPAPGGPAAIAAMKSLRADPAVELLAADMDPWAAGLYLVPPGRGR